MDKKVVMVFDDDKDTLMLCNIILERAGYQVFTCSNSNDIVEKVEAHMPNAILMDNWIPELGGVKATQLLKANDKTKAIPVIFFSANNEIKSLKEEAGADDYISKPFDIFDFEKTIKQVIQQSEDIELNA